MPQVPKASSATATNPWLTLSQVHQGWLTFLWGINTKTPRGLVQHGGQFLLVQYVNISLLYFYQLFIFEVA